MHSRPVAGIDNYDLFISISNSYGEEIKANDIGLL